MHNSDQPSKTKLSESNKSKKPIKKSEKNNQIPEKLFEVCICPNCLKGQPITGKVKHICYIENCTKTFVKIVNLRDHIIKKHMSSHNRKQLHNRKQSQICNWPKCGKEFLRADELRLHMCSHTIRKKFKCPKCNKEYMSSASLKNHIKKHPKISQKQMNQKKVKLKEHLFTCQNEV